MENSPSLIVPTSLQVTMPDVGNVTLNLIG